MSKSSRFEHCHFSDGLMWCRYHDGTWAHPFVPGNGGNKTKAPEEEADVETEEKEAPSATD